MAKRYLKTGVFGKENDGEAFVIVGDHVIYEGGCYEDIANLNDNLEWEDGGYICKLYECKCFNAVKDGAATVIWERGVKKSEDATETTPEDSITITYDQFIDAIRVANEKFMSIGSETHDNVVLDTLMGIQNLAFGALIAKELFGEEDEENEDNE